MKIAVLCGGPSLERGISLNSARSVMDHLSDENIEIIPIYFDQKKVAYELSSAQMYSNTPSDFDFKLQRSAQKLSPTNLIKLLKKCDLAFPVIHGPFGEDGEIQRFLEKNKIPFVGSSSVACKKAFDKFSSNDALEKNDFFNLPTGLVKIHDVEKKQIVKDFFAMHGISRGIVKPANGGSSLGVYSVESVEEAIDRVEYLFRKRIDTRVVLQPFCTGTEFTVIILQNRFGMPVAILPTETEQDYGQNQIFDFRRKYLPTNHVRYHCPPRFDNKTIEKIQVQAEQIFTVLGMRDFARFDGWVLPDGNIWFADFNPVSGMEQNSFLFQQGSRLGFSHRDFFRYVVKNAVWREGISMINDELGIMNENITSSSQSPFPEGIRDCDAGNVIVSNALQRSENVGAISNCLGETQDFSSLQNTKKPISVLFGGNTSERQVSLMSGTNVWLKLKKSKKYDPKPFFLDSDGNVWELPYALTLNHTVEEIKENCENVQSDLNRLSFLQEKAFLKLALQEGDANEPFFLPKKMTIEEFFNSSEFVFLALHGGDGENGEFQKILEKKGIPFNGPSSKSAKLCMDKHKTAKSLSGLEKEGIFTPQQQSVSAEEFNKIPKREREGFWLDLQKNLNSKTIIAKPQSDGCSSGVVRLFTASDLEMYRSFLHANITTVPSGSFTNQNTPLEMPQDKVENILFEKFVETDTIRISGKDIKWTKKTGWIEITVGVLVKNGSIKVLNPSITVAEGEVLSVEEKFQGGTGVNITPPPVEIVSEKSLKKVKRGIEIVVKKLHITGYSRIDAFLEVETGNIQIIEINSLPALTPSTVLYHQGLAESPQIFPVELLEKIIENGGG